MKVGQFIKSNVSWIVSAIDFLVEEVGKRDKEVQHLIKDKHQLRSEVSRVAASLEKEKATRLNMDDVLSKSYKEMDCLLKEKDKLEADESRFKAELKKEKTDRLKANDKISKTHKEF